MPLGRDLEAVHREELVCFEQTVAWVGCGVELGEHQLRKRLARYMHDMVLAGTRPGFG